MKTSTKTFLTEAANYMDRISDSPSITSGDYKRLGETLVNVRNDITNKSSDTLSLDSFIDFAGVAIRYNEELSDNVLDTLGSFVFQAGELFTQLNIEVSDDLSTQTSAMMLEDNLSETIATHPNMDTKSANRIDGLINELVEAVKESTLDAFSTAVITRKLVG